MPSAKPYERRRYGAAMDKVEDESGATQKIAKPSFESDPTRLLDTSDMSRREEAARSQAQTNEKLSVLGPTVCFKGELTADEDLMIQGRIEGSIRHRARHLTIGPKGTVKADIHANHIIVQGEVEGDLFGTEAVIIESSSRVRGNIFAPSVALKEGAKFKGSVDMDVGEPASENTRDKDRSSSSSKRQHSSKRRKDSPASTASDSEVNEILE